MLGRYFTLTLLSSVSTLLLSQTAIAQVIPDNTVGTIVTPTNLINGGTRTGNNLFHSFSQFSIPTNGSVIFNNPTDIQNIFSRVTGTTRSSIDGLIQAQGNVNLFLMNPNGIVFGPNAKLDIGGSFIGTTANSIKFADGVNFSSRDVTSNPLLTVSVPIGLQMGNSPGAIQVQGNGSQSTPSRTLQALNSELKVKSSKTLALMGGDIIINGGVLNAPEGQIALGSGNTGVISIQPTAIGLMFGYEALSNFQDIMLSQKALLTSSGDGGGNIQLQGHGITFQEGATAAIYNTGIKAPVGNIQIQATEFFNLVGTTANEQLTSSISSNSLYLGNSADIIIKTHDLLLKDGANISTVAPFLSRTGAGGNITIQADSIKLLGYSTNARITSQIATVTFSAATSGDIKIATGQFTILDGSNVGSYNQGSGKAGNLTIDATEFIQVMGVEPIYSKPSVISSSTLSSGDAGQVKINTQRLIVRDGGRIDSSTVASGNAGSVFVNASESVEVSGFVAGSRNPSLIVSSANILDERLRLFLRLPAAPSGAAGDVTINTEQLRINNGGSVTVKNEGVGNAGRLMIEANTIALHNGNITAETALGEGGNIVLNSNSLVLRDRSKIAATAGGTGNGGNITIDSPIIVGFENSDIVANAAKGRGGNIQITTQGIFGLKFRDRLTPENDITASSEFGINGTVQVNSLGLDPSSGLVKLDGDVIDSSRSIAKGCAGNQGNRFVSTGRGGIPQAPKNKLDRPWNDLRAATISTPVAQIQSPKPQIVEATHIQTNSDGTIALIDSQSIGMNSGATCAIQ